MKLTKKHIFLGGLIALIALLSFSPIASATDVTTDSKESLQSIFEANRVLLNEMDEEMQQLFIQIENIEARGGLPRVELPMGIRISTVSILRGFVNGINIPLVANIGGIGRLNDALFNQFTYSTTLSGNLGFPNGVLNGSNVVSNNRLPQQSIEAQIAAQEYVIYVKDAVRGALRLVAVMDTTQTVDMARISEAFAGAQSFLEFNVNDFNQKRNAMYNEFGTGTVTFGTLIRATRNVREIVESIDGSGYTLLIDVRNALLGSQENSNILANVLDYIDRLASGEILEKYFHLNFTDIHAGVDQLFEFLIADVTEARDILAESGHLTGHFATLLGDEPVRLILSFLGDDLNGGIGAFIDDVIARAFPGSAGYGLAHIMNLLLGDIDFNNLNTQAVVTYIDAAIFTLQEIRLGMHDVNLELGRQFVLDILSGEILDKYFALIASNRPRPGTLLRYIKDDIDGAIAALEVADLLDEELAHLLNGHRVTDLVQEYILVTLPHVINQELGNVITVLGDIYIGELVTVILSPIVRSIDFSTSSRLLQAVSQSLTQIIPVFDRIENLLSRDIVLIAQELNDLMAIAEQMKNDTIDLIQELMANINNQLEASRVLRQIRDTVNNINDRLDAIRESNQDNSVGDIWRNIRERAHEIAYEYRQVGRSRILNFITNSHLYNFLNGLFRR